MLERIIRLAIAHRWLVLVLALALAGLGVWNYARLPIDATPDITNVQVQINTEAPGYSPLEAEQRLTFPIETALAGLDVVQAAGGAERALTREFRHVKVTGKLVVELAPVKGEPILAAIEVERE